jgi:hypothetical protein
MNLPDLNRLLKYKHPDVLKMYKRNCPENALSAEQAFTELLKYLWISKKHQSETQNTDCRVGFGFCRTDGMVVPIENFFPKPMKEIDDMWHEFILFTQDYADFCNHYFGEFIHHKPVIPDDNAPPRELLELEIEPLLSYIYDNLGEETLSTWYSSFIEENSADTEEEENQQLAVAGRSK